MAQLTASLEAVSARVNELTSAAAEGQRQRADLARAVETALITLTGDPIERRPAGERGAYHRLVYRLRGIMQAAVPAGRKAAVVTRGDEELLRLPGVDAQHFPATSSGVYAGHHPADSDEAIAMLEAARAQGVRYLAFPATALWWLEHYSAFSAHLEARYRVVAHDPDTCVVYELDDQEPGTLPFPTERLGR